MQFLFAATVLISLVMGGYTLQDQPPLALHYFVIGMYFFVILFEFRGNPFSRKVYLLLALLLVGSAMLQFFFAPNHSFAGVISLLFAYFALQSRRRLND
ncbi:hypothetical protein SAMN05444487_10674 [Marininema mesophilum]|uniref:Uncharacterized protein n=1 Tax=Marininema mesophilum TaxID=1048340 RepID=A0A1H2WB65_9BACL|nr:hypothetical protein [Marininema mesophilum]SDW77840.1 hypothetical protein SAMN05444487_10674 [Marininema mesophilum]